jgi:hypothetical protein
MGAYPRVSTATLSVERVNQGIQCGQRYIVVKSITQYPHDIWKEAPGLSSDRHSDYSPDP